MNGVDFNFVINSLLFKMFKRNRNDEKANGTKKANTPSKVVSSVKKSKPSPLNYDDEEEEEDDDEDFVDAREDFDDEEEEEDEEDEEDEDEDEEEEQEVESAVEEEIQNEDSNDNADIEYNSSEDEKAKKIKKKKKISPAKSPYKGRQTTGARLGKQLVKDVVELLEKGKSLKKISSVIASKIIIEANQIQALQALNETEILSRPDITKKTKKRFDVLKKQLPKTLRIYTNMSEVQMISKKANYTAELEPLLKKVDLIQKRVFMMDYLMEQEKTDLTQYALVKEELQKYIKKNESACVQLAVDNDSQVID